MNASDIIQLTLLIVTALGTCASILISVSTLRQNNKMIEDSTRPCIVVYKETLNINNPAEYIVIKNFGSSFGTITNLEFDREVFDKINSCFKTELNFLKNITLAPNQKYMLRIRTVDTEISNIVFHIKYSSSTHSYSDTFDINLTQDYAIAYDHQNKGGYNNNPEKEIITISNSMQELIKRI